MPPFKRYRARRHRRNRPRNRRFKRSRLVVNRALQPIPQRFIAKMKYSELISVSDIYGRVNLNSIWDPNRSGIGHQPYGFDTLATLYNRYRVISCGYRIHAVMGSGGGSNVAGLQVAAQPANEELSPLTMSEMRENPRAKYIIQNPGAPTVFLTGKTYLPSLVGRTKAQYMADDRYQALTTGSPQELAILNIVAASGNDALLVSWSINILLEYTVEFFDVKHLAQS